MSKIGTLNRYRFLYVSIRFPLVVFRHIFQVHFIYDSILNYIIWFLYRKKHITNQESWGIFSYHYRNIKYTCCQKNGSDILISLLKRIEWESQCRKKKRENIHMEKHNSIVADGDKSNEPFQEKPPAKIFWNV